MLMCMRSLLQVVAASCSVERPFLFLFPPVDLQSCICSATARAFEMLVCPPAYHSLVLGRELASIKAEIQKALLTIPRLTLFPGKTSLYGESSALLLLSILQKSGQDND